MAILSDVVNDVVSPFADNAPGTPAGQPGAWVLLGFVRREFDGAVSEALATANTTAGQVTNGLVTDLPTLNSNIAAALATANTTAGQVTNGLVTNFPTLNSNIAAAIPWVDAAIQVVTGNTLPSYPAGTGPVFTGEPSPVETAFAATLDVSHAVLAVLGIQTVPAVEIPGYSDGTPPAIVTAGLNVQSTEFDGMPVYTLSVPGSTSNQVIVGLHGGAYVAQIQLFQWWTYAKIARDTGATVVVPVYPLAPQGTAGVVVPEIADLLSQEIDEHGAQNVSVLGDSAGGGMALAAAELLVSEGKPTPGRMVLLAPWLDATVSDPASQTVPDPVLNVQELQEAGVEWAGNLDPANPLVSPINGSLSGLPPTWVYAGSLDLLWPQAYQLQQLASAQGLTNFTFIYANGEIHDWDTYPFLPDAMADYPAIESELLGTSTPQSNSTESGTTGQPSQAA